VGSLTLPSTGLIYVDTQIVIYSVETHSAYRSTVRPIFTLTSRNASLDKLTATLDPI